jgi:hypothetical protein
MKNACEAAIFYKQAGLEPIPLDAFTKNPGRVGWPDERYTLENIAVLFDPAGNVGVLNGVPSGDLVDVDLDVIEAIAVASLLLPPTPCQFGRASKPLSHWEYRCPPAPVTRKYTAPRDPMTGEAPTLVEIRSTGSQTLWPGSHHPSGEACEFVGEFCPRPALVPTAALEAAVLHVAVATLLARYWPRTAGIRHEVALAAAGFLLRRLIPVDTVAVVISVAAQVAGDEEARARGRDAVTTARQLNAGRSATGGARLAELLGAPVVEKLESWFGPENFHASGGADFASGNGHRTESGPAMSGTDEWPEPDRSILDPLQQPAPRFPLEVFSPAWRGWIQAQAAVKGCPVDYVALALVSCAGALIGNARWGSPWPGWAEPPVLWVAAVGVPSSGKSPGLDASRSLLEALEREVNCDQPDRLRQWQADAALAAVRRKVWEAESQKALKEGMPPPLFPEAAVAPERPRYRRFITNDPTTEKVARLVLENPKGLALCRDELAGWVGSMDKYSGAGADRAFYLESFGGRRFAVDRMKDPEPIVVPALTLSIMGGIQPDRLDSLLLTGEDDGLVARFLWTWPDRIPPQRPGPMALGNDAAAAFFARLSTLAIPANGERGVVPFSKAAADALQAYRIETAAAEAEATGLYLSWIGKLPGMAVRLAVILEHLSWCAGSSEVPAPTEITEGAAVAAIALLDAYAMPMAARCFGEAAWPQTDRDARTLARWLVKQTPIPKTINVREVRLRHAPLGRKAARYDAAIPELVAARWLRQPPYRVGVGAPAKEWAVNPKLHKGDG